MSTSCGQAYGRPPDASQHRRLASLQVMDLAFETTEEDMPLQSCEVSEDMLKGACNRLVEGAVALTQ